jgi:hypothetical protein
MYFIRRISYDEMCSTPQICMLSKEASDKVTYNKVNICANQNETLMKQIQNNKKSIGKYGTNQLIDF